MMARSDIIQDGFNIARLSVHAGAEAAMFFYQTNVESRRKADGSLVTAADTAAEKAILAVIGDAFPDHSILTEETGEYAGRADARWIVDPLDGTHRFARGLRFWGPMVALELDGEIVAGAVELPALGENYAAAKGMGAFRNGRPIHVSAVNEWRDANVATGSLTRILNSPHAGAMIDLIGRADYCQAGGDLEGGLLVARGEAEVWIEYGVKPWDVAALAIIVQEAGGRFTDFAGGLDLDATGFLASNGVMHDETMCALNQTSSPQ